MLRPPLRASPDPDLTSPPGLVPTPASARGEPAPGRRGAAGIEDSCERGGRPDTGSGGGRDERIWR
jgi:hypothetical protein